MEKFVFKNSAVPVSASWSESSLKSNRMLLVAHSPSPQKFHQNSSKTFWVTLLTENSQIDKHTRQKLTPFVEITMHAVESKGGFRGGGGARGLCPQDAKHCPTWHWNNTMLVCTAMKNAINDIKLCHSFPPGLKFQAVYFKKCSSFWGTPSPGHLPGFAPGPHCWTDE